MQPYPWSPDLVWPGHLHGTGCLSARAVGTGFPTVVRRLCLGPVGGWAWVLLTPPVLAGVLGVVVWHGLWCCPSSVGCLWCSWLGFGFGLLMGRVWFRGRPACPPLFPVPACGVGVCAGPGSRLCPALSGWVVGVCFFFFLRLFFFPLFFFFFGCSCPGPCGPCPSIPFFFFFSGWAGGSLFFFPLRCPFSRWAAVPGLVLPALGGWSPCASFGVLSSVPSGGGVWPPLVMLAGGLAAVGCFRAVSPSPLLFFFFLVGGLACSSLCLPWACARTGLHSVVGVCVVCMPGRVCGVLVVRLGACPRLSGRGLAALFGVGAVCRGPSSISAVWFPAHPGWGLLVVCPPAAPFACPPPSVSFPCRLGRCFPGAVPGPSRLWWVGGGPCRRLGSLPLVFPRGGADACTPRQGVTLLYGPSICTRSV